MDGSGVHFHFIGLAPLTSLDHKSRGGNRFAPAAGATAWPRQASSLAEDIPAIMANRGLQQKAPGSIARERSHDVDQVMFNVPLRDAEQGGEFIRRT